MEGAGQEGSHQHSSADPGGGRTAIIAIVSVAASGGHGSIVLPGFLTHDHAHLADAYPAGKA